MNTLYTADRLKIFPIVQDAKSDPSAFVVEIQGKNIQAWDDYSAEIEKALHFPRSCEGNVNRYLDWIRDLTWFDEDFYRARYVIVVYDYSLMLLDDFPVKVMIENDFREIIFPWWDGEVEKCVVGGKRKQFDVYLVD